MKTRISRGLRVEGRKRDRSTGRLRDASWFTSDNGGMNSPDTEPAYAGCYRYGSHPRLSTLDPRQAFTLLEVMIAGGILFLCLFTILAVVANGLQNARTLQNMPVDPSGELAAEASLNLKLEEGMGSGDFGRLYPDYRWSAETNQVGTNNLFEVDFVVYRARGRKTVESHMSILLFRPDSPRKIGS